MAATLVLYWLIIAFLFLVEPWNGKRLYELLKSGRLPRMRFYRGTVVMEWFLTVIVLVLAAVAGIPLRMIGLVLPTSTALSMSLSGGILIGAIAGLTIAVVVTLARRYRAMNQLPQTARREVRMGDFEAILPRSRRERWAFAGVAVTAGICEEILFRGMPLFVLKHEFPALGPVLVVVITAVLFGVAHFYQGWKGVLGTGLIGAVFAGLYVLTGSLLLPIVLHALIDLRALLIRTQPAHD